MAPLKIWGRASSSNVEKVLWLCDELAIPFERHDLGGKFGGNDRPEYRALNPTGLVPTIEDEGFALWESNTILRYLARKHGAEQFLPKAAGEAALIERWMDWQLAHLNPAITPIFLGYVRTPPEKRDLAAIEAARQRMIEMLRIMEAQLAKTPYLGGQALTLADIGPGIWIYRWNVMPVERPAFPHVEAWYRRLAARPGYKSHVMITLE